METVTPQWNFTKDKLPTTEPGEQVKVYFSWFNASFGMVGMFTCWSANNYTWAEYSSVDDRYYEITLTKPDCWFELPRPPRNYEST